MLIRYLFDPASPARVTEAREGSKGGLHPSFEGGPALQRAAEAPPGTLEVNVLRMVGRCLVCSRLISTWVSSLEPPPSTPSPGSLPPPSPPPLLPPSTSALPLTLSPPERLVSTTSSGYTSLARRSKFTSVSYVSPRPIMDSSFSSRSRGSEPRATRSLPSPSASLGRHPTRALSHFRISLSLSVSLRSSILGASFCLALSIPRASLPRQVPGLGLLTLFPARTCCYPSSSLAFRLRRVLPLPFSSKFVSDGGRSFTLPTSIRRFYVSHPWVPATAPRSIHSPVRSDDTSSTPREWVSSGVGKSAAPHRIAPHRIATRVAQRT